MIATVSVEVSEIRIAPGIYRIGRGNIRTLASPGTGERLLPTPLDR